jgi:hypothetical protein
VDINNPPPGGLVGFGRELCGESFVNVDLTQGAHWIVRLWDTDHVYSMGYGTIGYTNFAFCVILGWSDTEQRWVIDAATDAFSQGKQVRVEAQLVNGDGTVLDTFDQPYPYDESGGLAYLEKTPLGGTGGGLTTEEHNWLDDVQQAVQRVFNDASGVARSTPIGSALSHPDQTFLNNPDALFDLAGRGSLSPPEAGGAISAYGLVLQVTTTPAGFGQRDGAIVVWNERIAQLATVHTIKTGPQEWVTEVFDLHLDTFLWLWRTPFPNRVIYDVTPGCVVTAQWVRFSL